MSHRAASWVVVACLAALAFVSVFLAASLGQVRLTEGSAFDETLPERGLAFSSQDNATNASSLRWPDYLLAYGPIGVIVLALLAYIGRQATTTAAKGKQRRLPATLFALAVMVAFALVLRMRLQELSEGGLTVAGQTAIQTTPTGTTIADLPVSKQPVSNTPGREARATSHLLQWAVGLLALGACAGVVVGALRARPPRRTAPAPREASIRDSIDSALRKLRLGRDAVGVVEECYRDMMHAYAESSGLDPKPLTPREFAHALEALGFGGPPLDELTLLFELVRYGRRLDAPLAPRALRCFTELRDSLAAKPAPADA